MGVTAMVSGMPASEYDGLVLSWFTIALEECHHKADCHTRLAELITTVKRFVQSTHVLSVIEDVLSMWDDICIDNPPLPTFFPKVLAALVAKDVIPLEDAVSQL